MRYQHAAQERGQVLAAALSDIATSGTVVPLHEPASKAGSPPRPRARRPPFSPCP